MRRIAWSVAVGVALALAGTAALAGRNVAGTYSNVSGPYVSGTVISSSSVNNQFNDYASALTGSLSRDGFGGMRAPLALTDGSAAAPSLTFNNDATAGWFRPGANRAALSIGGVQRLEQNASGLIETGWAQFAGTVTVGGALTVSTTGWNPISPTAGWTNGSGDQAVAYRMDEYGVVYLRGRVINAAGAASTTVLTLPAGYRPTVVRGAMTFGFSLAVAVGTTIDTSGNVQLQSAGGAGNIFYLDTVSFSTR